MPLNRLVNANQAPRCAHIKTSGLRCGSPARHGRTYCCFHDSAARRNRDFVLPIIEDAASLQLALNKILQAVADKLIDQKTATTLFYGLQIAFANLRALKGEQLRDGFERRRLAQHQQKLDEEECEDDEQEEGNEEEETDHPQYSIGNALRFDHPMKPGGPYLPTQPANVGDAEGPAVNTQPQPSLEHFLQKLFERENRFDIDACADDVEPKIFNRQSAIGNIADRPITGSPDPGGSPIPRRIRIPWARQRTR